MRKAELQKEIDRVQAAIAKTNSEHLRRDYGKYLRRLKGQLRGGGQRAGRFN